MLARERLQGGVRERNELRFIPIREAPRFPGGELHRKRIILFRRDKAKDRFEKVSDLTGL